MAISPGTLVGEYNVLGLIGAGGMGEVYRARDARLNRDIAIKLLPTGLLDDPTARARFQREARAVAALNHPNIVTIHEVGDFEASPFIAFELVAGETLKQKVARGAMQVADALDIAVPLAEGLRHAHGAGVIHRDLKPQNIMVRPDGQLKILDFGLGKFVAPVPVAADVSTTFPSTATEAGVILGTLGYTAPEHLQGHPVDARSDQFAFGAILYELLTGRRAFARETPFQTLTAIVEDEPTPLTALAPGVPARVAAIVNRCLRKDPEQRYATTADLVTALHVASDAARSQKAFTRRRRFMAAVVAAVALIAGVMGATFWPSAAGNSAVRADQRRIVVLPFANIGGDANSQAFADGLMEVLTTRLSGFERDDRSLLVVAPSEVRRDAVTSARDARRAYRATHVVSGTLQRLNDDILLTLNLTDAATLVMRGEEIRGDTVDAGRLQDAAVSALAGMLGVQRGDAEPQTQGKPGAFDYYFQGRGYLQRFERLDSVNSAIELFNRSIERDPAFALGHAALGEAYWRKFELTREPALVEMARQQVQRAVKEDGGNATVRVISGIVARGTGEYDRAVREFQLALKVDSTNADAYRELGRAYEGLEKFKEAEETYRTAIKMRPGDWSAYGTLGRFLAARGKYPEALEQFKHVATLTPDNARAYSNIGAVHLYLKQHDLAAKAFEQSVSIRPTPEALSNLGIYYFDQQQFVEAAARFQKSVELNGGNYLTWGNLASAYQHVPDRVRAEAAYEKAIELARAELKVDARRGDVLADLADYSQTLGRRSDARRYASQALNASPNEGVVLFKVAAVREGLGDRAQALRLLERAVRAGYPLERIQLDRSLVTLRKDPAFQRIVKTK